MTSLDALYQALPISSALVRAGGQAGCGGMAWARIDIEPASAYEFVDATPPPREDRYEDQETVDLCVTNVREGAETELTEIFGTLPAMRVVLHQVFPHPVDSNELMNRYAGRYVVRQALWSAGLADVYAVPERYLLARRR